MKRVIAVSTAALLSACGGGSGNSNSLGDNTVDPQDQAYLTYWKQSLSEIAGDNYDPQAAPEYDDVVFAVDGSRDVAAESYSTTNVQVSGVDELDLIEFDGEVLLTLNQSFAWEYWTPPSQVQLRAFNLATLQGGEAEDSSLHLNLPQAAYHGLTAQGEQVALISTTSSYGYWLEDQVCSNCRSEQEVGIKFWQYKNDGRALAPANIQNLSLEGEFIDARAMGGKLYIVTSYFPSISGLEMYPDNESVRQNNQQIIDALQNSDLQPSISLNGEALSVLPDSCELPEQSNQNIYDLPRLITVLEIDMQNPSTIRSACSLGRTTGIFMTTESLYLFESDYADIETNISKFSIVDGPDFEARGRISGVNYQSYNYGEVDGRLVVVNSEWDSVNWWNWGDERHQLHVIEQQGEALETLATLPNAQRPEPIGKPGEMIYAVRIFGDRAYVVTFDKVDPLYVIDLSNAADPEVLGELEIPGFSANLHPVSEDLVLGMGKNAIEQDGTTWFQGLNIRLFDVSDPSAPIAVENLNYGLRGSESELLYDPHALAYLADNQSGMARLTIPMHLTADDNSEPNRAPWDYYPHSETGLFQFELDISNKRLNERARNIYLTGQQDRYFSSNGDRSVIHGDNVYYTHGDEVDVIEWGSSDVLRSFTSQSSGEGN